MWGQKMLRSLTEGHKSYSQSGIVPKGRMRLGRLNICALAAHRMARMTLRPVFTCNR